MKSNPYYFTEEHDLFRQTFRDFLGKEVRPYVEQWEKDGFLPREIYRKFGDMGFFGMTLPETYGGMDGDLWYNVVFDEELARMNSGGFSASIGAHPLLALTHLNAEGSEDQKQRYLVPGIKGEKVGCLAITEPGGGSDVQAVRTTAKKDGDHYIVNGSKTFITNGVLSDFLIVVVRTDATIKGSRGLSLFIIDRVDDVRVPVDNLLGAEGQGFFYIMQHFVSERLSMGSGGVAAASYALELTLNYMNEREAFGKKINRFQELRHRIAQMSAEIEMNRIFVYELYRRYNSGDYPVKESSMCKLLGTQLADKVINDCLQMFGGYGYMESYPLARMFRDARLGQIGGGTSEIMREIISKTMIEGLAYSQPKVSLSLS